MKSISRIFSLAAVMAVLMVSSCRGPSEQELVHTIKAKVESGIATEQEKLLYEELVQQQNDSVDNPASPGENDSRSRSEIPQLTPPTAQRPQTPAGIDSLQNPANLGSASEASSPFSSLPNIPEPSGAPQSQSACSVTGNMKNFKVTSSKDIKSIQYKNFTGGTGVDVSLGGVTTRIKRLDDRTLEGRASGPGPLTFKVHHTDGTSSDIIVQ